VVDSNAANLSGCFDLSNPITVIRLAGADCPTPACAVSAGDLAIVGGGTSLTICAGDGISDAFDVTIDGAVGANTAWVVTDTNGVILALPTAPPFDLEGSGSGTCLIWHLVFDGAITGVGLDANADDIEGCFALSNPIRVERLSGEDCVPPCEVSGGDIEAQGGATSVTICVDDDVVELIDVTLSGARGSNSIWVVTDTSLNILALDSSNIFDLEPAGAGVCLIWHLSYEDGLEGVVVDSNAANLNGCFDLSNPVTVTRLAGADCPPPPCEIEGGSITAQDGATSVTICVDDDAVELIDVTLSGATGSNSIWVVTDTSLNILALDSSNQRERESV